VNSSGVVAGEAQPAKRSRMELLQERDAKRKTLMASNPMAARPVRGRGAFQRRQEKVF